LTQAVFTYAKLTFSEDYPICSFHFENPKKSLTSFFKDQDVIIMAISPNKWNEINFQSFSIHTTHYSSILHYELPYEAKFFHSNSQFKLAFNLEAFSLSIPLASFIGAQLNVTIHGSGNPFVVSVDKHPFYFKLFIPTQDPPEPQTQKTSPQLNANHISTEHSGFQDVLPTPPNIPFNHSQQFANSHFTDHQSQLISNSPLPNSNPSPILESQMKSSVHHSPAQIEEEAWIDENFSFTSQVNLRPTDKVKTKNEFSTIVADSQKNSEYSDN
jgi:hypothetical protein